MAIKIGAAFSLGHAQNWKVIPDDRQKLLEVLDDPYVAVVDNGRHETGDKLQFTATFKKADWETVKGYWDNRTLVDVTADDGTVYSSRRVKVNSWTWPDMYEKTHVIAEIEIWGV